MRFGALGRAGGADGVTGGEDGLSEMDFTD